jgi:hypothetical protein
LKKTAFVLGFVLIGSLVFGDIIEDIEKLRAWDLADAYYKAGQQYIVVGKDAWEELYGRSQRDLPRIRS